VPHTTTSIDCSEPGTCGPSAVTTRNTVEITHLPTARIRQRKVLCRLIYEYEWAAQKTGLAATLQVRDRSKVMNLQAPRRQHTLRQARIYGSPEGLATGTDQR
jgi:hypothetical protein